MTPLVRIPGGARYALSAAVESVTSGVLRPFVVIYAVTIGLDPFQAGVALSIGMLAGLAAIPLVGRWIDTGALRAPSVVSLLVRAAGALILMLWPGVTGFATGVALIGIGTQVAPPANNALIAALAGAEHRAAALAATRSIRNAGLGIGALTATTFVAGGPEVIGRLSLATAVGCTLSAAVLTTIPLHKPDTLTTPSTPPPPPATSTPAPPATLTSTVTPTSTVSPTPPSTATRNPAPVPPAKASAVSVRGALRPVTVLALAGIPFAFYADVLEIALPVTLVRTLHASPAWSSAIFVGNTVLVIALQVIVVVRLSNRDSRAVLAVSGVVLAVSYLGFWLGAVLGGMLGLVVITAVAAPYTMGEILYTGSSVPLVIESAPPHLLGRALSRWQLTYALARTADPMIITGLLGVGTAALWAPLATATLLGAGAVAMSGRARTHRPSRRSHYDHSWRRGGAWWPSWSSKP